MSFSFGALAVNVQETKVLRPDVKLRRRRLNYCLLSEIWKLIIVPARSFAAGPWQQTTAAPSTVHLTAVALSSWSRTDLSQSGVASPVWTQSGTAAGSIQSQLLKSTLIAPAVVK